jgi:hypothetical protein
MKKKRFNSFGKSVDFFLELVFRRFVIVTLTLTAIGLVVAGRIFKMEFIKYHALDIGILLFSLFIPVVLILLAAISYKMGRVSKLTNEIHINIEEEYGASQYSLDAFNFYFKNKALLDVNHIRIINVSNNFNSKGRGRDNYMGSYHDGLENFLKRGGKYSKVCSYNLQYDIDVEEFLKYVNRFSHYPTFSLNIIEGEAIKNNIHTTSIMLLDDQQVCFKTETGKNGEVVCTKNPIMVKSFRDKFDALSKRSKHQDLTKFGWYEANLMSLKSGRAKSFNNSSAFEDYLEKRVDEYILTRDSILIKEEKLSFTLSIRTIHLSSHALYEGEKYFRIIKKLLENGGEYQRLICKSESNDNYEILKNEFKHLVKYKSSYKVHILKDWMASGQPTYGSLIISDNQEPNEVCIGGSYTKRNLKTLSYGDKIKVAFYSDLFNELLANDQRITVSCERDLESLKSENLFKVISDSANIIESVNNDIQFAQESILATSFGSGVSGNSVMDSKYFNLIVEKLNTIPDFQYSTAYWDEQRAINERMESYKKINEENLYKVHHYFFSKEQRYLNVLIIDDTVAYFGFPSTRDAGQMETATRVTNITTEGQNYIKQLKLWYEGYIIDSNKRRSSKIIKEQFIKSK